MAASWDFSTSTESQYKRRLVKRGESFKPREREKGKNQLFSSFNRQYLENGSRYGQSYY